MKTLRLFCAIVIVGGALVSLAQLPPKLLVEASPNSQVRLSWTNTATGFVVEEVDQLPAVAPWSPVLSVPQLANQQFSVVLNNATGDRFFRLTTRPGGLPPEPALIAPPVPTGVATILSDATAFLYTGANPIQTGVVPGTIDARRAAVVRGQVTGRDNTPLTGVTISILNHPEFGQTFSRADGRFDLAVNGGGLLAVKYEKAGFCPVQRQLNVPWQDYVSAPDVVMIQMDPLVTPVALGINSPMQLHQGSVQTDADGARRATVMFMPGTAASLVLANGTTVSAGSLNVRATEFTVGASGPAAMPAGLPPSSGYTYCVELSADEATALGATSVQFDRALPVYVENFLGFPVGGAVPTGYYDRQKGQWIASANGRVIKVLSITGGLADLDTDGDNITDDATKLTTLGVTAGERLQVAQLYPPGQTLWRVPITHFTPWDCNWPYGPPPDATSPPGQGPNDPPLNDTSEECGSIIGVENQTLGESLPVTGTPWRLHYKSDRSPGRKEAYTLDIPVSGPTIPASLRAIRVEVDIAGRLYKAAFAAAPNLTYTVVWDGLDIYGRLLQGAQTAVITVSFDYQPKYYAVSSALENSFAQAAAGASVSFSRAGSSIALSKTWTERVGPWDARALGLGGWSLSLHHAYDPVSRTLLLGNGQQRRAAALPSIISTVAGNGTSGFSGDDGPATAASLGTPTVVAVGPDGSLYIAEYDNNRIRRVGPSGIITTVAGTGVAGFSGDGGPAVAARIKNPYGLAVGSDGSLFIADAGNHRIRRVAAGGKITTVAGTGIGGFSGDGGPATVAQLNSPHGLALSPDGSLFIADLANARVRRIGTDGNITTVAGISGGGFSGDGGPAVAARLLFPSDVALGADGTLYFVDRSNQRVRRVGIDGIITTVAGTGVGGFSGDGGPAVAARIRFPDGIAVAPDGNLYIADLNNQRIRRVGPDGIINTVAGTGNGGFGGDGGPATAAQLNYPDGIALGPDGRLYIAEEVNHRIRQLGPALPGYSLADILLPSGDGREIYFFNSSGRHLKTLDALTGSVRYEFTYNSSGYLTSITDNSGNVTTIQRSGARATAIVAPGGQRTALVTNADGWLTSANNPAAEAHTMSYSADGLMDSFTDPLGHAHRFTYDPLGRLIKNEDPAGGSTTLSRSKQSNGYTVTTTTALGRTRAYQVEQLPTGAIRRSVTQPGGATTVTLINTDGSEQTTYADGGIATVQFGPDPRWGMLAPVATSMTLTTPGGLTRTITTTRTATLSDPNNLLSLTRLTDTVTGNGAVSTRVYDGTSRLFTGTTPAGRSVTLSLDALGRITQEQIAGLAPVGYAYDSRGLVSTITEGSGATSRTTTLVYNAARDLTEISDALGRTSSFAYDSAGRLVTRTLPDGRAIQYTYDAAGNATAITPPGRPPHGFAYTPIDLLSSNTPPDLGSGNTATHYTYNADRALTRKTRPDGQVLDFDYDSGGGCNCGRLSTLTLPTGVSSFAYDATTGKLTGVTAPGGIGLSYSYDGALLTGITWTGPVPGTIAHAYNNDFGVTAESVNGASSVNFAYDADGLFTTAGSLTLTRNAQYGLLTSTTLGGVTDSSSYNSLADLTDYSVASGGTGIYSAGYVRDALGRITQKTETVSGVTTVFDYLYDLAGRLVEVKTGGSTTAAYTYDGNGNRLTFTGPGGTVNGTYDNQDRLLTYGSATYSHTAHGEWLSKTAGAQTTTYQYDALGNLTAATLPGGPAIEYLIDGRNRRVGKKVGGSLVQAFLYQGQLHPVAELDGAGNVVSRFVYATRGNVPAYLIKGGLTYRIIADHLGSPRLVIDVATGTIAQRMDYDEFGQVLNDSNPGFQPFGFAGGLYDRDTKLIRFGARDYDAVTGRWTAKDPTLFLGEDVNLYLYAFGDPVNFVDPAGRAPVWAKKLSNFIAGFGDTLSFGLSKWARDGIADSFDLGPTVFPCQPGFYTGGQVAGALYGLALGNASPAPAAGAAGAELNWAAIGGRAANARAGRFTTVNNSFDSAFGVSF